MTLHSRFFGFLLSGLLFCGTAVQAQWNLSIDSVDASAFPKVRALVTTRAGNLLRKDLSASNYTVWEDGFIQDSLVYKGTRGSNFFDIGILMNSGSSASAQDIAVMRGTAGKFVDSLDGLNDQCALITYDNTPVVMASMQSAKSLLHNSLAGFTSGSGANRLWDGVYGALNHVAFNSVNSMWALLVMSNGLDDGSGKTFNDVVALAKQLKIPIYTLGINAGGGISNLQDLADRTGGILFNSPDRAVETLVNLLRGTPSYCILEYVSSSLCRDGAERALNVRVRVDNDSTFAAGTYPPAADPASNVEAGFAVDTGSVASGKGAVLGLLLKNAIDRQPFRAANIDISFDKSVITLTKVETDSGLLPGSHVSFVSTQTGAEISIGGVSMLNGSGRLLKLFFSAAEVAANTDVTVEIESFNFIAGCLIPKTSAGRLRVLPRNYSLSGSGGNVYAFVWNDMSGDYDPPSAAFTATVTNTGDLPVTGLTAALPASDALKALGGATLMTAVEPQTLAPGEKGTAVWHMRALPRSNETSVQLDVAFASSEGVTASARLYANIKPAGSAVTMRCSADTVRVEAGSHSPRPAEVTAVIRSAGVEASPAGQVSIEFPGSLTLVEGTPTQTFSSLTPGTTQTLKWKFDYPVDRPSKEVFPITLALTPVTGAADTCIVSLEVPPITGPDLQASCLEHPDTVRYDSVARAYPEVILRVSVKNSGSEPSSRLTAALTTPPEALPAPGETLVKIVSEQLGAGDSAEVSWRILISQPLCENADLSFGYELTDETGTVFDCSSSMHVTARPNLPPYFTGILPSPVDTLAPDKPHVFRATATDDDGDALRYAWSVDGAAAGAEDSDSLVHTFSAQGPHEVKCSVSDSCGATVEAGWFFVVHSTTSIGRPAEGAGGWRIIANAPNPFASSTMIQFEAPSGNHLVTLDLVDAAGRTVAVLLKGPLSGGLHSAAFDAAGLPSGLYHARLRTGSIVVTRAVQLVR